MQVVIPDLGDADSVEVIELCVSVGDAVGSDDPLIVIESDKASMEVPAGTSGTVDALVVAVGDTVTTGDPVASIVTDREEAQPAQGETETESDKTGSDTHDDSTGSDQGAQSAPGAGLLSEPSSLSKPDQSAAPAGPASSIEVDVCVPDLGEAEGVEVVEVGVSVGDTLAEGDLLVILESDKASMEVPSDRDGEVVAVHVQSGDTVDQDAVLVTLKVVNATSEVKSVAAASQANNVEVPASHAGGLNGGLDTHAGAATIEPIAAQSSDALRSPEVYAGPAVRRLARELGVDLKQVKGSGNKGRLLKEDVKAFVKQQLSRPAENGGIPTVPAQDYAKFGAVSEQSLGKVRVLGAKNLHRSWLNVVHVTQHDDADITDLEDFRRSLKGQSEAKGVKVTPLAFIIKACCAVLKEFPIFNSSLDEPVENYVLKHYYHIGFAVDTPHGLVVPVIRDADQKGIWELSAEILDKAGRARDRKLSLEDMQGGSFSVSSLGAIGGTGFTPIVNAPEVAILGVGRMTMKPRWNGEEFVPAKMLPLSLSYDHRAINGAEAGRFVNRLTEVLGDVRQLVL